MLDHLEIQCDVRYNGIWIPAFICADHLPGTTINQTSSDHVLYTRVIAASDIEDFSELNCSMTLNLITNYRAKSADIPTKPKTPVFEFFWKTPAIRIVDIRGKYTVMHALELVPIVRCSNSVTASFMCTYVYVK